MGVGRFTNLLADFVVKLFLHFSIKKFFGAFVVVLRAYSQQCLGVTPGRGSKPRLPCDLQPQVQLLLNENFKIMEWYGMLDVKRD